RHSEREVFNNILVQSERVPGTGFAGIKDVGNLREGGNLLWGLAEGPSLKRDVFASFRASKMFAESRKVYEAGWTTQDIIADPKFRSLPLDASMHSDLRLQSGSPAIDAGIPVPGEWPDPIRSLDSGPPDVGALPDGAPVWRVGIDGRLPLFGPGV